MLIDEDSTKPKEEIDFILTCKDDIVKRDLLYNNHKQFATMYYEIMPNIKLQKISEYPLLKVDDCIENEYKIEIAEENSKILQLLRK